MCALRRNEPEPNLTELENVSGFEDRTRRANAIDPHPIRAFEIENRYLAVVHLDLGVLVRNRLVVDPNVETLVASDSERRFGQRELRSRRRLAENDQPGRGLTLGLRRRNRIRGRDDVRLKCKIVVANAELVAGGKLRLGIDPFSPLTVMPL